MAANFWQSSHAEQWMFDKAEILRWRCEDLKIYTEEEYAKFNIFWANFMTAVSTEGVHSPTSGGKLRQQVIATAVMYFKRFYLRQSFKDMCPFLVACTACYLACKVEEHTSLSVTSFLKNAQFILPKRWGYSFDNNITKNGSVYDAEFILVEIMDCCLIVYHPNRPLNVFLSDIKDRISNLKDFDQIEAQCHKVVNDTLRCDVGLQFAPSIIAMASFIVGTELMGRSEEFLEYLSELSLDYEKVGECVDQIYKMYKIWKAFDEKEQVKQLIQKLPKINYLPPAYQ